MREDNLIKNRQLKSLKNDVFQDIEALYDEKYKQLQSENNADYELEDFFNEFEKIMSDYKEAKQYIEEKYKSEPTEVLNKLNKKRKLFGKHHYKK